MAGNASSSGGLIIDCDTCTARGVGCDDCVVTALLDIEPGRFDVIYEADYAADLELDPDEARALEALASGGLIPPLRLSPRAQTG